MTPPVITADNLTKVYGGKTVVDQVSFTVQPGEFLGILGPNGAGKTTTLRMLLGLTRPAQGKLSVLGFSIPDEAHQMRARVGLVPQQDNLDPDFTVIENLQVFARYFGRSLPLSHPDLTKWLQFAQLEDRASAKVQTLSGGMKRRLTLARALVNEPELLVLDEPTTGLDPQARQLIWQRLRALQKEGRTLVLTTHFMEEAERLCDRILIIDHGRILESGPPHQLIARHIEPHVFEIHGDDLKAKDFASLQLPVVRHEWVGETLFGYALDEKPVLTALQNWPQLRYMHRKASLEDVFLKLTGRELRDG